MQDSNAGREGTQARQDKALYVGNLHSSVSLDMLEVGICSRMSRTLIERMYACMLASYWTEEFATGIVEHLPCLQHRVKLLSVCNETQEIFSSLGEVKEIRIIKDKLTGLSAGYGFVRYLHPPVADLARQVLNGAVLCGLV